MDRISLRSVRALGRHGANPGERDVEQPFDIDLDCWIDLRSAQASDDLGDTVNYADLHAKLCATVRKTSHALLERLAGDLLAAVFADPRIVRAKLTIAKPRLLEGATPAVTLVRKNPRCR